MTTFTTEDREAMQHENGVIQGVTGAQYTFMDTSPQAQEITQIINGICGNLQALATVINRIQTAQNQKENDCGK